MRLLPETRLADADTKPVLIAKADISDKSGVVLDYDEEDGDVDDFTFQREAQPTTLMEI